MQKLPTIIAYVSFIIMLIVVGYLFVNRPTPTSMPFGGPAPQMVPQQIPPLSVRGEKYRQEADALIAEKELDKARRDAGLDDKEHQLDSAMRRYELQKREEGLRSRGIMPQRQEPGIVIEGIRYPSYEYFKTTPHYTDWKARVDAKHYWAAEKKKVDEEYEKILRQENFRKLNERSKLTGALGWYEQRRAEAQKRAEAWMGSKGPWLRQPVYIPPSKE